MKPDNAISVVETDVNVDFAPPKDYKEPDYKAEAEAKAKAAAEALAAEAAKQQASDTNGAAPSGKEADEPEEPKLMVFGGALLPAALLDISCTCAPPSLAERVTSCGAQNGHALFCVAHLVQHRVLRKASASVLLPTHSGEPCWHHAGAGNRLDGKAAPASEGVAVPWSRVGREATNSARLPPPGSAPRPQSERESAGSAKSSASGKAGKVVFGDSAAGMAASNRLAARLKAKENAAQGGGAAAGAPPKPPAPKKDENAEKGFTAFEGAGRSLKD